MLDKLKDRRGEFLLEGAVKLLFLCAGIALVISVFSVAFQANKLHVIAKDIVRMTEIQGQYDAATVAQEFQRLKTAENLESAVMDLDAAYITGSTRVQFGDPITVTVSYTGQIGIGGFLSLPVPLSASVTGRSERYWK